MAKFSVECKVTRMWSYTVEVEADDEYEAEEIALEMDVPDDAYGDGCEEYLDVIEINSDNEDDDEE